MSRITVSEILAKSQGGMSIYKKIIPEIDLKKKANFRLKNPFYADKNPSMSLYYKDGQWKFHDYGSPEYSGDVFKFASYLYNLDLKNDFRLILEQLNDDLDNLEFSSVPEHVAVPDAIGNNTKQNYELISLRHYDGFSESEIEYLNLYGITKDAINNQKVIALDKYSISNEKIIIRPKDDIWFGYVGKDHIKVYCPRPKKKFWYIGTKPKNYYFGSPIDYASVGENIFITGGEKDVLTLVSRGYLAICLNSETANLPEDLLNSIHRVMLNPILLYDNDDTGTTRAKMLSSKHNIKMITLPEELKTCGGKDISDFFRLGYTDTEFDKLVPFVANDSQKTVELIVSNEENKGILRTAQQRLNDAKNQPDILMMLDVFMHSGELAILFGDTGIGKSVLAVCIADALSRGINLMDLENQCIPQKVIYYDFELSDKQFAKRYSDNEGRPHIFSDNFYTDYIDFSQFISTDRKVKFEQLLIDKLKTHIIEVGATVIIIDNITYLSTQTSQDAQVAMEIMKLLKHLKEELQISILVLAHTPKRPPTEGITINHLAGSKHISNFADSVFAIGISKNDKSFRYMKQVKPSRSGELKFDDSNVVKCELLKDHDFLTFSFSDFCEEKSLLSQSDEESEEDAKLQALELRKTGMTIRDIATKIGFSKSKVGRWLQEVN